MNKLLSTVQKVRESVWDNIERFHNLSLMCPAGMPCPCCFKQAGITSSIR